MNLRGSPNQSQGHGKACETGTYEPSEGETGEQRTGHPKARNPFIANQLQLVESTPCRHRKTHTPVTTYYACSCFGRDRRRASRHVSGMNRMSRV